MLTGALPGAFVEIKLISGNPRVAGELRVLRDESLVPKSACGKLVPTNGGEAITIKKHPGGERNGVFLFKEFYPNPLGEPPILPSEATLQCLSVQEICALIARTLQNGGAKETVGQTVVLLLNAFSMDHSCFDLQSDEVNEARARVEQCLGLGEFGSATAVVRLTLRKLENARRGIVPSAVSPRRRGGRVL